MNQMLGTLISDTHGTQPKTPAADFLIHAGDLSDETFRGFERSIQWLGDCGDYPQGVYYTPGNHDYPVHWDLARCREVCQKHGVDLVVHEPRVICGIKFFFSPYSCTYGPYPFMGNEQELANHWAKIPQDTEVLVVHGPAQGLRDLCRGGRVGSSSLRYLLDTGLPDLKLFVHGHIHENAGWHVQDARYLYLNACVLSVWTPGLYNDIYIVDTNTWTVVETHKDTEI